MQVNNDASRPANIKAAGHTEINIMQITLRFGFGNTRQYNAPEGATLSQVLNDSTNRQSLGYQPDRVRALINRVSVSGDTRLAEGDVIELETAGTSKAS